MNREVIEQLNKAYEEVQADHSQVFDQFKTIDTSDSLKT